MHYQPCESRFVLGGVCEVLLEASACSAAANEDYSERKTEKFTLFFEERR